MRGGLIAKDYWVECACKLREKCKKCGGTGWILVLIPKSFEYMVRNG